MTGEWEDAFPWEDGDGRMGRRRRENGKTATGEWDSSGKTATGEWEDGDGRMGRRRRENGNGPSHSPVSAFPRR